METNRIDPTFGLPKKWGMPPNRHMETPKNMETHVVWPAGQVTIVSTFPHHENRYDKAVKCGSDISTLTDSNQIAFYFILPSPGHRDFQTAGGSCNLCVLSAFVQISDALDDFVGAVRDLFQAPADWED